MHSSTSRLTSALFDTSIWLAMASCPLARTSAAVCSALSPDTSAQTTAAPSAAKRRAAARPMPEPAPVTIAILLSSLDDIVLPWFAWLYPPASVGPGLGPRKWDDPASGTPRVTSVNRGGASEGISGVRRRAGQPRRQHGLRADGRRQHVLD